MKEEWREVVGYEKDYMVSNYGRVVSTRCSTPRILHGSKVRGYPYFTVMTEGGQKLYTVHRAVALAFIEKPDGVYVVNHKDGNKENNHVTNLEWCTYGENNKHAHYTGLKKQILPVVRIPKFGGVGYYYPSQAMTVNDGFHQSHVSAVCLGKHKSHGGFFWESVKEFKLENFDDCRCAEQRTLLTGQDRFSGAQN